MICCVRRRIPTSFVFSILRLSHSFNQSATNDDEAFTVKDYVEFSHVVGETNERKKMSVLS